MLRSLLLVSGLIVVSGWWETRLRPAGGATVAAARTSAGSGESKQSAAASGLAIAMLGGFRELTADLLWVQAYRDWTRHDADALARRLAWVGRIDPESLAFWLNGARMLAYDVTAWRGGRDPAGASTEVQTEQAQLALAHLHRGQAWHGDRAAIWVEEAMVRLRLCHDPEGALRAFEQADRCPDAPYFVGRLRGEMLLRLGRPEQALAWLRALWTQLPAGDPAAMREVVAQRIHALETALQTDNAK